MNKLKYVFLPIFLLLVNQPAHALDCAKLGGRIAKFEKRDQDLREALWTPKRPLSEARKRQLEAAVEKSDRDSSQFVGQVLGQCGWPLRSKVGTEVALSFSLLTVHATEQPALQRYALHLMTPLVSTGEASREYFAILTDKIRVKAALNQVYGTQLNEKLEPYPIDDESNVDLRRAALGMPSLKQYIDEARSVYQPQAATK
jgi:hypothetical protein